MNHTMLCQLCDMYAVETVAHTMFLCPGLEEVRARLYPTLLEQIPAPLKDYLIQMSHQSRTDFILSGFKSQYVPEWQPLYELIARLVADMFENRRTLTNEQNMIII